MKRVVPLIWQAPFMNFKGFMRMRPQCYISLTSATHSHSFILASGVKSQSEISQLDLDCRNAKSPSLDHIETRLLGQSSDCSTEDIAIITKAIGKVDTGDFVAV